MLTQFPPKQYRQAESAEFLAAKKALADVQAGQTRQALSTPLRRLSVSKLTDPNFESFQHASYTIRYPASWRLDGDSTSTVTIYPEGGRGSDGSLEYGAMISGFSPEASASKELDTAITELIADIEQTNPDLRIHSSPQAFQLGSLAARRVEWIGKSAVHENGEPLKKRVLLFAFPGKSGVVLYAVFVAPDPDFSGLWPTFERMLNSLQVL
jgi:hypothetical protein